MLTLSLREIPRRADLVGKSGAKAD